MGNYAVQLGELVSAAEAAYKRARIEIYDRLPAGARVDFDALNESQRDAFENLVIAEAELANFRHSYREPDAARSSLSL